MDKNEDPNSPTNPNAAHKLALTKLAQSVFPHLKPEDIRFEHATGRRIIFARMYHKGVAFDGGDWVAIIETTSTWRQDHGNMEETRTASALEVFNAYCEVVRIAHALRLLRDDIEVNVPPEASLR